MLYIINMVYQAVQNVQEHSFAIVYIVYQKCTSV